MILYNTLMGVCAGALLLVLVRVIHEVRADGFVSPAYGVVLVTLGVPLTALSTVMALTWPLNVNPPINIVFAEPNVLLGVAATVGGVALLRSAPSAYAGPSVLSLLRVALRYVPIVGLVLLACAAAILRFNLVGDAPDLEPITGQFKGWENTFFAVIYGLAALGALLTRWWEDSDWAWRILRGSWLAAGWAFLLFATLNFYTHVGLLVNIQRGTHYTW